MNKETTEQIIEKLNFLVDHANFYYEQRLVEEPFLREDYPFLKMSAKLKREIEELLRSK